MPNLKMKIGYLTAVVVCLASVFNFAGGATFAGVNEMALVTESVAGIEFSVDGIRLTDSTMYQSAPQGYKYLYVDLTAKNNTNTQVSMTSRMMFSLSDAGGNRYNMVMPEEPGSFNGLINSNQSFSGHICYMIPESVQNVDLKIKPFTYKQDHTIVSINTNGVVSGGSGSTGDNETNNNGDATPIDLSYIGDSVRISGLDFTVDKAYIVSSDELKVPEAGNDILTIEMTVKNNNRYQVGLTSTTIFSLYDSNGNMYRVLTPETVDSVNGLINSRRSMSGKIRFEVPQSQSEYSLKIKPVMFQSDYKLISLEE